MNTPRVLHIAPGHRADHMRIFHRECRLLAQCGYSVELIAQVRADERLDSQVGIRSLGEPSKLSLSWQLGTRVKRCWSAYQMALGSTAELLHFHSLEFVPWAIRLRRARARPIIFDCMEDFEGYALQRRGIPDWLRRPLAAAVRGLLKRSARICDASVVADEGTARFFRRYARKVVVIHNFPDLHLFPVEPREAGSQPEYDLVYHGSVPRYHLEAFLAIDAALIRKGYQARWRLFGTMPDHDWFLNQLLARGFSQRFHVTGLIPHDQVASEIRKAKLGIIPLPNLPKFQNNIPQKLFEFMALGMPVVLSDLPPSRPFVEDQNCALTVPPDDPEAYATAILSLLENPELCAQMGKEGRRRVEREYNWQLESHKLVQLYKELLA